MASGNSRLRDDLLVSIGIVCAVLVGIYALLSVATVELGSCEIRVSDGFGDDRSDPRVRGDLRWNWLPPSAECAWSLDERGEPVGAPVQGAAVRTDPKFDPIISWVIVASAVIALTTFTFALWTVLRRRWHEARVAPRT